MSKFEFASIVCHVGKPTLYFEMHGEEEVKCVAVPLRVMEVEDWSTLAATVWNTDKNGAAESLKSLGVALKGKVTLNVDAEDHLVTFKRGNKNVLTLLAAKINSVRFDLDDVGMTMRVQTAADAEMFGVLAGLAHEKVRVSAKFDGVEEEEQKPNEEQHEMDVQTSDSKELVIA